MAIPGSELEKRIASLTTLRDNLKNSIDSDALSIPEKIAIRKALTEVKTELSIQVQRSNEIDQSFKDYTSASQELSDLKDKRNEIFNTPGSEVYATEYDKLIEQAKTRYETAKFKKDLLHNYIPTEQLQKDLEIIDNDYDKYFSDPDFTDANLTKLMQLYGINEIGDLHDIIKKQLKYQQEHPEETLTARIEAVKKEVAQKKAIEQNKTTPTPSLSRAAKYRATLNETTPEKKEVVTPTHKRMTRVERAKLNGTYGKTSTEQTPKTEPLKVATTPKVEPTKTTTIPTSIPIKKEATKPKIYPTPAANIYNPTREKSSTYNMDSGLTPAASPLLAIRDSWFTRFKNWIKNKFKKNIAIEVVPTTSKDRKNEPYIVSNPKEEKSSEEIMQSIEIKNTPNGIYAAKSMLESLGNVTHIEAQYDFYHYKIIRSEDKNKPDMLAFVKEDIEEVLRAPEKALAKTLNTITADKKTISAMKCDLQDNISLFSKRQVDAISEITADKGRTYIKKPTKENADTYIKKILLLKSSVDPHLLNLAHSLERPENIDKFFEGEISNGKNVTFSKTGNYLKGVSYNIHVEPEKVKAPLLRETLKSTSPAYAQSITPTKNTSLYKRPTLDKKDDKGDER